MSKFLESTALSSCLHTLMLHKDNVYMTLDSEAFTVKNLHNEINNDIDYLARLNRMKSLVFLFLIAS